MTKEITRRKFITQATSTLGVTSLLMPNFFFAQEKNVNFDNVRNNIKKAVSANSPPSLLSLLQKRVRLFGKKLSDGQIEKSESLQQLKQDML
jgi:hypothetical protein